MTFGLGEVGTRLRRLVHPLRDVPIRRLLLAFLVSELGDGVSAVVVPLAVYGFRQSVTLLAATFGGRLLLGSVAAAAGGWAADRWPRARVLVASYVVRAGLVLGLIGLTDGSQAAFALVGVLVGALGAFDNPAAEAMLRSAYRSDFQALATVRKTGRNVSALVGPAVGAVLVGLGGARFALAVDAATFVVALVLVLSAGRGIGTVAAGPPGADPGRASLLGAVRAAPVVPLVLASSALGSVLVAMAIVLAIPYLETLPAAPDGAYGYALAGYAVGALAGLWIAGMIRWRRPLRLVLVVAAAAYGLLCAGSVLPGQWWVFVLAWCAWGVAFGPEEVVADARLTAAVPPSVLGRIYGTALVVSKVSAAAGYGLVALLPDLDPRTVLLVAGLGYAVVAPVLLALLPSGGRDPAAAAGPGALP